MDPATCNCMYAIICSDKTTSLWPNAPEKLRHKYETKWPGKVQVLVYPNELGVSAMVPELSRLKPSFTCFLAHHSECNEEYVRDVNKLTRQLDSSSPYTDTLWGILTGLTEEDVLFAVGQGPLEIKRVTGNCPIDLDKFQSGVWYSETQQCLSFRKQTHQDDVQSESCPPDTTTLIAKEISDRRNVPREEGVDMIITSGHATERDLNLGYTFNGGQFRCHEGQLYGCCVDGSKIDIQRSRNPKILSAAGNCLMGHISDEHCMALGWLHSGCVVQMVGYIVPTWFGYGGWGVHKYFINNPGCMTFAEAFFANQQSLIHELNTHYSSKVDHPLSNHDQIYQKCFDTQETASPELSRDCSGLLYDQDNVAFYGDPAWEARLVANHDTWHYEPTLSKISEKNDEGWTHWSYKVVTTKSGRWDCPVPDDKSTASGRPPVCVFPTRVRAVKLVEGDAVVTCRFVLLPLTGSFSAGEQHVVVFAIQ